MSILTDLKDTILQVKQRLNNVSNRVFEVERSAIVAQCSVALSDYNAASDLYLTVTYSRANGTVALRSVLSNLNSTTGLYMQVTESYYNSAGTTIIRTVVSSLTYDGLGKPTAVTITSVTP